MSEPSQFDGLRKLPTEPVAKVLAQANAKIQTPLDTPASALAAEVLSELSSKYAVTDMLLVLAHCLPAREATWWACLSGRDLAPAASPTLKAAEEWVLRPGADTRQRARDALDSAAPDDATELCAMAACCADGTLGPGEFEDYNAPAGTVGIAAYSMALMALYQDADAVDAHGQILVERALDIARGGNGQIESWHRTEPKRE
ncbi:MAG: hypothetical protein AAF409_00930 [Pseudomonadota bacterium]